MKGTFEIKKASDGRFVFNLKAANHQVILTSQPYETKASAEEGIQSVKHNARTAAHYHEKTCTDGSAYFLLHAANNKVIGRSQMYSSPEAMRTGIAAVKHAAPAAQKVDLSIDAHSAAGRAARG